MTLKDGSLYVGHFKNDLPEGSGEKTMKDGSKYVGEFSIGKYSGKGVLT